MNIDELIADHRPDSQLTHEEILDRNYHAVDAHFHNETPENVEKAIALYAPEISWEAPSRGVVLNDPVEVLAAYRGIFTTLAFRKMISLRRFATEDFVFDDQIVYCYVVGDPTQMANFPFPLGTEISLRMVHCFEMRDGRISREIAYELWRKVGSAVDNDEIPEGSVVNDLVHG